MTSRSCPTCPRRTRSSSRWARICCGRCRWPALARYDSDLITIPKYAGKTNEQFTKLLLNLTILLARRPRRRMLDAQLVVLDPLCGRGTTLNQALMYGYDAIGIEIDGKDVEAYAAVPEDLAQAQAAQAHRRHRPGAPGGQAASPAASR